MIWNEKFLTNVFCIIISSWNWYLQIETHQHVLKSTDKAEYVAFIRVSLLISCNCKCDSSRAFSYAFTYAFSCAFPHMEASNARLFQSCFMIELFASVCCLWLYRENMIRTWSANRFLTRIYNKSIERIACFVPLCMLTCGAYSLILDVFIPSRQMQPDALHSSCIT